MFQTRLKTTLMLLLMAFALATSFLIGPVHALAASPDFSLSASPSSRTVERGQDALYTIQVSALNGFAGTVNLTVTGVPNHDFGDFSNPSVTGTGTSQLDVHANRTESPLGTFTLSVTGTSGGLQHTIPVTLTVIPVPDFTLFSNPFTGTVKPGGTAVYQLQVTTTSNFVGTVNLSVTGLPANATASFTVGSVNVPGNSELDIHTTTQTPTGSFPISLVGTSSTLSHTLALTLEVIPSNSDFTISVSPTSQTISKSLGENAVYTVHITAKNGFNGTVNFTPETFMAFFDPESVTTSGDVDFLFNAANSSLGTFTLTITATSGPIQHTIQVTCTVTA